MINLFFENSPWYKKIWRYPLFIIAYLLYATVIKYEEIREKITGEHRGVK